MANSAPSGNLASSRQKGSKPAYIEDILASQGVLTSQQLTFVKSESRRRQESVEKILTQMSWVNDEQLAQAKGQVIGVPYLDPAKEPISPEIAVIATFTLFIFCSDISYSLVY